MRFKYDEYVQVIVEAPSFAALSCFFHTHRVCTFSIISTFFISQNRLTLTRNVKRI